jgi:hypothetical protein
VLEEGKFGGFKTTASFQRCSSLAMSNHLAVTDNIPPLGSRSKP